MEGAILLILMLAILALVVYLNACILKKAGYSLWWLLLLIVPLFYWIMVWMFAFADWPAQQPKQQNDAESS